MDMFCNDGKDHVPASGGTEVDTALEGRAQTPLAGPRNSRIMCVHHGLFTPDAFNLPPLNCGAQSYNKNSACPSSTVSQTRSMKPRQARSPCRKRLQHPPLSRAAQACMRVHSA
eukprot:1138772-Pelagomonas_calceolata.AAC.1